MFIEDTGEVVARISNIASILCAHNSYMLKFRDMDSKTLIYIGRLLLMQ